LAGSYACEGAPSTVFLNGGRTHGRNSQGPCYQPFRGRGGAQGGSDGWIGYVNTHKQRFGISGTQNGKETRWLPIGLWHGWLIRDELFHGGVSQRGPAVSIPLVTIFFVLNRQSV
jgi:hypothetical protein